MKLREGKWKMKKKKNGYGAKKWEIVEMLNYLEYLLTNSDKATDRLKNQTSEGWAIGGIRQELMNDTWKERMRIVTVLLKRWHYTKKELGLEIILMIRERTKKIYKLDY